MTWRVMNRILGLDFGRARIGVAISDELQMLAHPLETIPAHEEPASRVAEIVRPSSPGTSDSRRWQPTVHCARPARKLGTPAATLTRSRRK